MRLSTVLVTGVLLLNGLAGNSAESLLLPSRPVGAPSGKQLIQLIERMSPVEREAHLFSQIVQGNVPSWNTNFIQIQTSSTANGSNCTLVLSVLPEYLAVGTDQDYFLAPMTPLLAQRLADRLGCILPTRKIVNLIWTNSAVKLNPQPIPASEAMVTVPVFATHNSFVREQRDQHTNAHPLGTLVSGHKKDVIVSSKIYTNFATSARKPVVIYGWHYTSGQPIQPVYNGHGETYVDYSHGIRLVRATARLNGVPVPITNLLTSPELAVLVSDEGAAEGTTNGVIAVPRYNVTPVLPRVLDQPRSARVRSGEVLELRASACGDNPLYWTWQQNGTNVFLTTTNTLQITNVQPSHSGSWLAIVSNAFGSATSRIATVRVGLPEYPVLFRDNFESGNGSAWQVKWAANNNVQDHEANFIYDHKYDACLIQGTTLVIPPAPGSDYQNTHAARFSVNSTDNVGSVYAVSAFTRQQFSNDFSMSFDCWLNYPGGPGGINSTGSTQHAILGINHSGQIPAWIGTAPSDGLWFAASGEGGDQRDYRGFLGNLAQPAIELIGQGSGLIASNNASAFFLDIFPQDRFETPGAPGKQWVRMALHYSNNIVSWFCDDHLLARRINKSSFTSGSAMIGLMDIFASIANPARDSFLLVDNVLVEDLTRKPRILVAAARSNDFEMLFSGVPGRQYAVESSTDLGVWRAMALVTAPDDLAEYKEALTDGRKFFRVSGPVN